MGARSWSSSRGCPPGCPIAVEQVQSELARRRLGLRAGAAHAVRAGRGHDRRRGAARAHARARRWPSRSGTPSGTATPTSGRRRCRCGPRTGPTQAPLTEVRPGHADLAGHAEVRLHRRPRRAGAGVGTRDRRPGRGRLGGQGAARRARRRHREPRHPDGRGPLEGRRPGPGPADLPQVDESRGALLRRRRRGGDGRRDQGGGQGRRQPRRHRRGARLRRAGRAGQPRALGPQARRAAGPSAHVDPGREGRGDRRRLRGGRAAGERRPRPDHLGRRRRAPTGASRRWPAASRAASPPARCSWPAPR